MVDVIRPEACAYQLLEQVGLFVGALGGAEARKRLGAVIVPDFDEPLGCHIQRFFPSGFAEVRPRIGWIDLVIGVLGPVRQPDQRFCQAVRMMNVVEAETPLDAEAVVVGGTVAPFGIDDLIILDLVGDLAADATERTE